jgi:hypothetical protein
LLHEARLDEITLHWWNKGEIAEVSKPADLRCHICPLAVEIAMNIQQPLSKLYG